MAINIKNSKVEAAIRELARRSGVDLTEAIRVAVDSQLRQHKNESTSKLRRMQKISQRVRMMPLLDARPADVILGYDEFGLPS